MFEAEKDFLRKFNKEHGPFGNVLDVGSLNINGQVRDYIDADKFIGIDMQEGDGVDMIMNAHDLPILGFKWAEFDLITCVDMLEHDVNFWKTVEYMRGLLKHGGYLLICAPSINFFKHNYPDDYYRFTESVFEQVFFEGYEDVHIEYFKDDQMTQPGNDNIFGYARKPL